MLLGTKVEGQGHSQNIVVRVSTCNYGQSIFSLLKSENIDYGKINDLQSTGKVNAIVNLTLVQSKAGAYMQVWPWHRLVTPLVQGICYVCINIEHPHALKVIGHAMNVRLALFTGIKSYKDSQ